MSIILGAVIETRPHYYQEMSDLPTAASTTKIKDSLDFEVVVYHYLRERRGVLS